MILKVIEQRINIAYELNHMKKNDPNLYKQIEKIIKNAKELQLIRDGKIPINN